jgi:high-affinity Fe2+/Pb2+ permease
MFGPAIIVLRETFEATLIIGIVAAATRGLPFRDAWLLGGIGAGVSGSLIVASITAQIAELAEGALGLFVGAVAGYGLYAGFLCIPARLFFVATSGLILLLAAAMASQSARFLVQANILPSLANPLWNTSWLLDNTSVFGRFLHALVGYEAMPSGIQVVSYTATLILILAGMRLFRVRPPSPVTS